MRQKQGEFQLRSGEMVDCFLEPSLTVEEFIDVLVRSTLSERRPIDKREVLAGMLKNASLIVTARNSVGMLVGVSRAITDFSYCTYLSDLAVDVSYRRTGIGGELVRRTHEVAGLQTMLVLLAAPAAREYYGKIGMTKHDSAWIFPRV
jgi:ribosomal protein S18 acetylase RimI-like enzyme